MQSYWLDCMPAYQLLEMEPSFREPAFLTHVCPSDAIEQHRRWSALIQVMTEPMMTYHQIHP